LLTLDEMAVFRTPRHRSQLTLVEMAAHVPLSESFCTGGARRFRIEEMATLTAMAWFRPIDGERDMLLGELLAHALDAFVPEQDSPRRASSFVRAFLSSTQCPY
jgi:hypothetical protein